MFQSNPFSSVTNLLKKPIKAIQNTLNIGSNEESVNTSASTSRTHSRNPSSNNLSVTDNTKSTPSLSKSNSSNNINVNHGMFGHYNQYNHTIHSPSSASATFHHSHSNNASNNTAHTHHGHTKLVKSASSSPINHNRSSLEISANNAKENSIYSIANNNPNQSTITANFLLEAYIEKLARHQLLSTDNTTATTNKSDSSEQSEYEEFRSFLLENPHYSTTKALINILKYYNNESGIELLLLIGHSRECMSRVIQLLVSYNYFYLSNSHVSLLISKGYSELLLYSECGTILFDNLHSLQQLQLIMIQIMNHSNNASSEKLILQSTDTSTSSDNNTSIISNNNPTDSFLGYLNRLSELISVLDLVSLQRLISFIDPQTTAVILPKQKDHFSRVAFIELYLLALIYQQYEYGENIDVDSLNSSSTCMIPSRTLSTQTLEFDNFQSQLESALTRYYGQFRLAKVLFLLEECQNYLGMAKLYQLSQSFNESIKCKLQHSKVYFTANATNSNTPTAVEESKENSIHTQLANQFLLQLIEDDVALVRSPLEQSRIFRVIISYWIEINGSNNMVELESKLIHCLNDYGEALLLLAFPSNANAISTTSSVNNSNTTTTSNERSPPLPFSARFYLHLTRYKLVQYSNEFEMQSNSPATNKKIHDEIQSNLNKNKQNYRKFIKFIPATNPSTNHHNNMNDPDLHSFLVFSCGHNYVYRHFVDSIVPEFLSRMQPLNIPITLKFLLSEYQQSNEHMSTIRLACPICVYNSMLQEYTKIKSTNSTANNNSKKINTPILNINNSPKFQGFRAPSPLLMGKRGSGTGSGTGISINMHKHSNGRNMVLKPLSSTPPSKSFVPINNHQSTTQLPMQRENSSNTQNSTVHRTFNINSNSTIGNSFSTNTQNNRNSYINRMIPPPQLNTNTATAPININSNNKILSNINNTNSSTNNHSSRQYIKF